MVTSTRRRYASLASPRAWKRFVHSNKSSSGLCEGTSTLRKCMKRRWWKYWFISRYEYQYKLFLFVTLHHLELHYGITIVVHCVYNFRDSPTMSVVALLRWPLYGLPLDKYQQPFFQYSFRYNFLIILLKNYFVLIMKKHY